MGQAPLGGDAAAVSTPWGDDNDDDDVSTAQAVMMMSVRALTPQGCGKR